MCVLSGALLITGSALLWQQSSQLLIDKTQHSREASLSVKQTEEQHPDINSAFKPESVKRLTFQDNSKDIFDFLLVNYRDADQQLRNALLFPKKSNESVMLPSPTGLRQSIWQTAAETIQQKAPQNALLLSWWDDGQRLHFLTGRETWLSKPGLATFSSPLWQHLQSQLNSTSEQENDRLTKMATWLTMDSEQALKEIRDSLGNSQPIYIMVNNDLLMRLAEMADYGGTPLTLTSRIVPVSSNMHGDISSIKQIAQEEGDGNYLVQKEGAAYRLWLTPKQSQKEKNTLLIRLLPFVDSLKQLPSNVQLVYQSHWGGYLSIYRINPE